jgi:cysteine desulfurase family protein (TIGR01976 family)
MALSFDVEAIRAQYPALSLESGGKPVVYFDGPGGSQVPRRVVESMSSYLYSANANAGGNFLTSQRSDAILQTAHARAADFLNAPSPDEIIFGANMTTLTFAFSRAVGRTLKPGDEVLVTRLDHDANVGPWVRAAEDAGATVQFADIHPEDSTLNWEDLERKVSARTRVIALGVASNASGSINDIQRAVRLARTVGARVYVDAVHMAPHGPIDVQAYGCDALACSAYKFFGPHVGILWAKKEYLDSLPAYKVRPATDQNPGRWMTGTQNHEGIAGTVAALEYLAEIGQPHRERYAGSAGARQGFALDVFAGMSAIRERELTLQNYMLAGLTRIKGLKIYGITDPARAAERAPTFSFRLKDLHPEAVTAALDHHGIFAWFGNFYAMELCLRLDLEATGGLVRVGLLHYNTQGEVDRLLEALSAL